MKIKNASERKVRHEEINNSNYEIPGFLRSF